MPSKEEILNSLCQACFATLDDSKRCTACKADNTQRPLRYRFFKVKAFEECPDCKSPVPINGAMQRVQCDKCFAELDLLKGWGELTSMWKDISKSGRERETGFFPFMESGKMERTAPACNNCDQKLPAATISVKTDGPCRCGACGESTSVFPAPPWLKKVFPKAEQFFCAERDAVQPEGQAELQVAEAVQPTFFQCPGCGSNLTITAESDRTLTCDYCQASAYLPDPLWRRFHPVRTAKTWYMRIRTYKPKQGKLSEGLVRCPDHGLLYDANKSSGCSRCS